MNIDFTKYNHIAILGGTFNPVHNGHIHMAKNVLKWYTEIEAVCLMPNNHTAYKDNTLIVSNEDRLNMLKLAVRDEKGLYLSRLDIDRGGITYTIDTIRDIKAINANIAIDFIIGADSLLTFTKWYCYEELLGLCRLIVIRRECEEKELFEARDRLFKINNCCHIEITDITEYPASSTEIRNKLINGERHIPELNKEVLEYIKKNKLYVR